MALFSSFLQPLFALALLMLVIWLEFFREHKGEKRVFFGLLHFGLGLFSIACLFRQTFWDQGLQYYQWLEVFLKGWFIGSLYALLACFYAKGPVAGKKRASLLKLPWLFGLMTLTVLNLSSQMNVFYLIWILILLPLPLLYNHEKLKRVFNHYGLFAFSLSLANLVTFNTLLDGTWIHVIHNFFWVLGVSSVVFGLNTLEETYE